MEIKKILLIRPDMLGDIIFLTPVISAIKEQLNNPYIAVLTKESSAPLLSNNPDVDEVIIDWFDQGKRDFWGYVKFIKDKKFDAAINFLFHPNRFTTLMFLAQIPLRAGDKGVLLPGFLYNRGVFLNWKDLTKHEIEFLFNLLKPFGVKLKDYKMHLYPTPEAKKRVEKILRDNQIDEERDLIIGIHPGTSGIGNKPWNAEGFARLIDILSENFKAKIILISGPTDEATSKYIMGNTKAKPLKISPSLEDLIAITSKFKFFIGGDTGPTHIAAALGIPVVDIFPSKQKKPSRWAPWKTKHIVIKKISECPYPCIASSCQRDICQKEITIDEVLAAIEKLIRREGLEGNKAFFDWCRKTFNILIVEGRMDKDETEECKNLILLLKKNGFNINILSFRESKLQELANTSNVKIFKVNLSIKEILNAYLNRDINLVHIFGRISFMRKLILKISSMFTALYIEIPPRIVESKKKISNIKEAFDFYVDCFRR